MAGTLSATTATSNQSSAEKEFGPKTAMSANLAVVLSRQHRGPEPVFGAVCPDQALISWPAAVTMSAVLV